MKPKERTLLKIATVAESADAPDLKPGPERGEGSSPSGGTQVDPRKFVVHCKKEPFDVYIGRPGPWGNPFSDKPKSLAEIKVDSREEAIACYEEWIRQNPELLERIKKELKGKVLGCWCAPKECHGDVLARIANGREDMLELARNALVSIDARKDEDIDEWAEKLAASVAELDD